MGRREALVNDDRIQLRGLTLGQALCPGKRQPTHSAVELSVKDRENAGVCGCPGGLRSGRGAWPSGLREQDGVAHFRQEA